MSQFYPPNAEDMKAVMESKGHKVFEGDKGYDLNIFGIRTNDLDSNKFNDWLGTMYLTRDRVWSMFAWPATTDPGTYWREHPMNVNGTAILKPGQWRGSHMVGTHKGYPALQQKGDVTVYRDANRDTHLDLDEDNTMTGNFGINLHRANENAPSPEVNKWSAACQVTQDPIHFAFLMELARKSVSIYGNSLSYILLTEGDFRN